jgi:3',5'-cyclic AMP phosphodiesterase CpdA
MPSETARETAVPNPMPRSRPGGYGHRRAFLQLPAALLLAALSCPARPAAKETKVDYVGFEIPDVFVVGYGMDYAERFRNLSTISIMRKNETPSSH